MFSELHSFSALPARPPALRISSGKSKTPFVGTKTNNPAHLDWLTTSNSAVDAQCVFNELANPTGPPDPEIESPRVWEDAGALEDGLLGGKTEEANSRPAENAQASENSSEQRICLRCCRPFTPRQGNGGKPQRYCSTACRKGNAVSNTSPNDVPNANDGANVGEDVGEDIGADDKDTAVPEQLKIEVYFNPLGDVVIMQRDSSGPYVRVRPENVQLLARRLQEIGDTC